MRRDVPVVKTTKAGGGSPAVIVVCPPVVTFRQTPHRSSMDPIVAQNLVIGLYSFLNIRITAMS